MIDRIINFFIKAENIRRDYLLHSFYGMCIYIIILILGSVIGLELLPLSYTSLILVISVAIAKELWDILFGSGFDYKDIIFTILFPLIMTFIFFIYSM